MDVKYKNKCFVIWLVKRIWPLWLWTEKPSSHNILQSHTCKKKKPTKFDPLNKCAKNFMPFYMLNEVINLTCISLLKWLNTSVYHMTYIISKRYIHFLPTNLLQTCNPKCLILLCILDFLCFPMHMVRHVVSSLLLMWYNLINIYFL